MQGGYADKGGNQKLERQGVKDDTEQGATSDTILENKQLE